MSTKDVRGHEREQRGKELPFFQGLLVSAGKVLLIDCQYPEGKIHCIYLCRSPHHMEQRPERSASVNTTTASPTTKKQAEPDAALLSTWAETLSHRLTLRPRSICLSEVEL